MSTEIKIPKRFAAAEGREYNNNCFIAAAIEPSTRRNRSRNGVLTIKNEKVFRNRIGKNEIKIFKNEGLEGCQLIYLAHNSINNGRGTFYLNHPSFNSPTGALIKHGPNATLFQNMTVKNGIIQEKVFFTYDGGFLTESAINLVQADKMEKLDSRKQFLESIKDNKVIRRKLISGDIYVTWNPSTKKIQYVNIYLGRIVDNYGKVRYLFIRASQHTSRHLSKSSQDMTVFENFVGFKWQDRIRNGRPRYLYSAKAVIGLPAWYYPNEEHVLAGRNIFRNLPEEQYRKIIDFVVADPVIDNFNLDIDHFQFTEFRAEENGETEGTRCIRLK